MLQGSDLQFARFAIPATTHVMMLARLFNASGPATSLQIERYVCQHGHAICMQSNHRRRFKLTLMWTCTEGTTPATKYRYLLFVGDDAGDHAEARHDRGGTQLYRRPFCE
jgi:hypothetical protein